MTLPIGVIDGTDCKHAECLHSLAPAKIATPLTVFLIPKVSLYSAEFKQQLEQHFKRKCCFEKHLAPQKSFFFSIQGGLSVGPADVGGAT